MKKFAVICAGLLAAGTVQPALAATERPVSRYLQCDGNPNNMSAGEGIARFIGAVTLLALFAPEPESPDGKARLFGAEGVNACSSLIDGEDGTGANREGNVARRLPLILARSIHHIEALEYEAALQDVALTRREATSAGLDGDIYFDRSFGQSIDRIETAALVRLGRIDDAKAIQFAKAGRYPHSMFVVRAIEDLVGLSPDVTDDEIEWLRSLTRINHADHWVLSARLQLAGRWQEAAEANDSYREYYDGLGFEEKNSEHMASSAIVHFIAGDHARGRELSAQARANNEDRRLRGKPDSNEAIIVEALDYFAILEIMDRGDLALARQRYGGRSRWTGITLAQRLYASRNLRANADPAELIGALEVDEDAILAERRQARLAEMLEQDKDNETLFAKILPYADTTAFESQSSRVWNTGRSKLLGDESPKAPGMYYIDGRGPQWQARVDSMLLHSALLAKSRGVSGFTFWMETDRPYYGFVRFGNLGDPGMVPTQYMDADAVIAELREAIPSPEELTARRALRRTRS